jgi:hypothetical protein
MSKSNTFETNLIRHIFLNEAITLVGDAAGLLPSTLAGNLYLGLCLASPGEAGDQTTNECTYPAYARQPVPRSGAGWTVSGNQVNLFADVDFPRRTDGGAPEEMLFFTVGTDLAGAGKLLYFGPLVRDNLAYVCTADATADTILAPGTAYAVNDRVVFFPAAESTLPGGITDGLVLYIRTAPGGGVYTLSTTAGGALYNISANGAAIVQKLSTIIVAENTTPRLTTGTRITED